MFRGEANKEFSAKYGQAIGLAAAVAVVVHVAGALYAPPYAPTPYQLRDKKTVAVNVPDFQIAAPPPEIARPAIPQDIEESDTASEEETIAPTDFDPFEPPELDTGDGQAETFFAFDTPPEPIRQAAAVYPDLAREAEAEGRVWVRVTIDETGRVIATTIEKSEVIPSLEKAAMAAARKWLFKPAKQRDKPVKVQIVIPFNFSLRG